MWTLGRRYPIDAKGSSPRSARLKTFVVVGSNWIVDPSQLQFLPGHRRLPHTLYFLVERPTAHPPLSFQVLFTLKTPSVEPVVRSRLLPRVSFRLLFALTTLAAVLAAVARAAGSGAAAAKAVMVGLGFLVACFLVFTLLFLISWCVSSLRVEPDDDAMQGSPFADGQLPPQILPPREGRS